METHDAPDETGLWWTHQEWTAINAPGYKAWEAKCILETTASGLVLCFIYQSAEESDASSIWKQWRISSRPLAVCVFRWRWLSG